VSGPVELHGGGEFEAGDEACVSAVLQLAAARVGDRPIRVIVVPTATARFDPGRSAAHGVAAYERVARRDGLTVDAMPVLVVDAATAADPIRAGQLAAADIIAFPGGDPDLIATVMPGSAAWAAIVRAHAGGAVLAGASAGAMALAPWTWTPGGGVAGLDIVPGLVVVPHADEASWTSALERFGAWAPVGLHPIGLGERTAAITTDPSTDPIQWQVVGTGEVRWLADPGTPAIVLGPGDTFQTPGRPRT
jgi:cyanophycinase-like exopeptidase